MEKITAIAGDSLIVQMRPVVGAQNEVFWTITRNGAVAHQFTVSELTRVITTTNTLLAQVRGQVPTGVKP